MAWNRLMLTAVGKTLYAKAQQGKPLVFTRVGIGDGNLGGGSLVNRTALISEKKSLLIDAIQIVNEMESAVITSLSNTDLVSGFYFREIGVFARDPDTQAELLYLYDNAGADGEYIPDKQSGVSVSERLKFLLLLENVATVSFIGSGNPVYLTVESIDDTITGTGTLWSSSKVAAAAAAAEAAAKAASRPVTWTPSAGDVGAIPASQKGIAGGVAELDSSGKVVSSQLPSYVDDVLEFATKAAFPATGETGKIYVDLATNLTWRWSGSVYVEISPSLALGETIATAYRGDRGKAAYDHSQATGNPHGLTLAQLGAAASNHTHAGVYEPANAALMKTNAAQTMTAQLTAGGTQDVTVAQMRNITAGTADLTAGTSPLATGAIYFVYE